MSARIISIASRRARRRATYAPQPLDPARMARFEPRETLRDWFAHRFPPLIDSVSFLCFCAVALFWWVALP